jgi:hypothetical protein
MSLVALLLLPFLGSLLTALVPTRARTILATVAGLVSAGARSGNAATTTNRSQQHALGKAEKIGP